MDPNPSLDMGNGGTNLNSDSGLDRGNGGTNLNPNSSLDTGNGRYESKSRFRFG